MQPELLARETASEAESIHLFLVLWFGNAPLRHCAADLQLCAVGSVQERSNTWRRLDCTEVAIFATVSDQWWIHLKVQNPSYASCSLLSGTRSLFIWFSMSEFI